MRNAPFVETVGAVPLCCALNVHSPVDDETTNFLTKFDFTLIDEMDPSLEFGHSVIYYKNLPCEIRYQDASSNLQEVGTVELCRIKILIRCDNDVPSDVIIELSSENDLFFHYTYRANELTFRSMQESQKLMIDFREYPQVLMKMFNSCIKETQSFIAVFVIEPEGKGHLDFIQNMEYKFIELLTLEFLQSNEETVRKSLSFRYNSIKSKAMLMQARLQDISAVVKLKNPALYMLLQKNAKQQLLANANKLASPLPADAIRYKLNSMCRNI